MSINGQQPLQQALPTVPTLPDRLNAWLQDSNVTGNKQEAVDRILQATLEHHRILDLSDLGLSKLPPDLDLLALVELHVKNNTLSSLDGLERCVNLQTLDARNNHLTTLTWAPPQLQRLLVDNNRLRTLQGLERCMNLQTLHADHNPITTLRPLASCTQLQSLSVVGDDLQSLSGIAGAALRYLNTSLNPSLVSPLPSVHAHVETDNAAIALNALQLAQQQRFTAPPIGRERQLCLDWLDAIEAPPSGDGEQDLLSASADFDTTQTQSEEEKDLDV